MDLHNVSSAAELLSICHPHFGKIQNPGFFKSRLGILAGANRKAVCIEDMSSGKPQTVALHVDPRDFMVTIVSSFVLMTMKDGSRRPPVILKKWKRVDHYKGVGVTEGFGTTNTYMDSDGLKWKHTFESRSNEDELIAYGSVGEEVLIITLETPAR